MHAVHLTASGEWSHAYLQAIHNMHNHANDQRLRSAVLIRRIKQNIV